MKRFLSLWFGIGLSSIGLLGADGFDYEETLADIRAADPDVDIDEETLAEAMKEATPEQLASLLGDDLEVVKICAAAELGRRGHPAICLFLRAGSHRVRAAAAQGIVTAPIVEEGLQPLAKTLDWCPVDPDFTVSAILANVTLGTPTESERLFKYATGLKTPKELRAKPLHALKNFDEIPRKQLVEFQKDLSKLLLVRREITTADFLAAGFGICDKANRPIANETLKKHFEYCLSSSDARALVLLQLREQGGDWQKLIETAYEPDLWATIFKYWYLDNPQSTLKTAREIFGLEFPFNEFLHISRTSLAQEALLFLSSLKTPEADQLLEEIISEQLSFLHADDGIWLEVEEILAARGKSISEDIHQGFAERMQAKMKGPNPEDAYPELLAGGDPNNGLLISMSEKAGCINCHAFWDNSDLLKEDGKIRLREHVLTRSESLRAIIAPNHELTDGYGHIIARMKDGTVYKGTPIFQHELTIEIRLENSGALLKIKRNEIAELTKTSPMPSVLGTLSKREIRDLVAYLAGY